MGPEPVVDYFGALHAGRYASAAMPQRPFVGFVGTREPTRHDSMWLLKLAALTSFVRLLPCQTLGWRLIEGLAAALGELDDLTRLLEPPSFVHRRRRAVD